jgi:ankyrin repeat protein
VSSAHPAGAGLMPALVEILLDYGAAINGLQDDESPLLTALDFGYLDAAETLAQRGARVDNVATAAALGRLDLVRAFVVDVDTLAAGVPLVAPAWVKVGKERLPLEHTPTAHIAFALAWACKFRRREVAAFLLDTGVSPAAKDGYDMTALHWATANGLTDLIQRLLSLGAPLEGENIWGGTVLDSTAHFAEFQPVAGVDYPAVLEMIAHAGADMRVLDGYPPESRVVAEFLRKRGRTIG